MTFKILIGYLGIGLLLIVGGGVLTAAVTRLLLPLLYAVNGYYSVEQVLVSVAALAALVLIPYLSLTVYRHHRRIAKLEEIIKQMGKDRQEL